MTPYKFVQTDKSCPRNANTELIEKADTDVPLTRQEKDRLSEILYGVGLGARGGIYCLLGWAWPVFTAKQVKRILVQDEDVGPTYRVHYAADKTALRKVLFNGSRREMIYVDK